MTLKDCRGLALSTGSRTSLDRFETALELFHGYYGDPLAMVDKALADDPAFVMGHALRAGLLLTAADASAAPLLAESVRAAEKVSAHANERERRHIAAARAWADGDFARSVDLYGDIVIDYPRDILALQVAHIGDFLLGRSTMLRDRIAQVLPHWNKDLPGFGYVLGMHAFGLEETNRYDLAEATGRQALDINRRDPWAIHAVAHVMEMLGRPQEGIGWLTQRSADWAEDNQLAIHNWWHLALFHLDLGNIGEVLSLYDTRVRAGRSTFALNLIDACAMLWRLKLRGIDAGTRWHELADICEAKNGDGYYAFNDVHSLMAYLGSGRPAQAEKLLRTMYRAAHGDNDNAAMTRDVGLAVARALIAFDHGDYAGCIEALLPVRLIASRFGGSHAQRDLIHLTLTEAALRGGRAKLARALVAERLALKPTSTHNRMLSARVQHFDPPIAVAA